MPHQTRGAPVPFFRVGFLLASLEQQELPELGAVGFHKYWYLIPYAGRYLPEV